MFSISQRTSTIVRVPIRSLGRLVSIEAQVMTGDSRRPASSAAAAGSRETAMEGVSIQELPKSSVFTSKLPADAAFPTPQSSEAAPRSKLGPRLVKGAAFTYVRPEAAAEAELLAVSPAAMADVGLRAGEEQSADFQDTMSGRRVLSWDAGRGQGVYPWAQCYGGYQFGQWAGQLGDGRAISLFEATNPHTGARWEVQLKGAGRTPYSRFADGRAVLRSSVREFIASEALHALRISSTRALALTLLPQTRVQRERVEPGAVVARLAPSWIRLGTFDLARARADTALLRQLATYVAEEVLGGWHALPAMLPGPGPASAAGRQVPAAEVQGSGKAAQNRFARLYREVVRRNAATVAAWQAYGFMNGVLNTDNTSVAGLSIDFGPFAFMDNFDPDYTPNHDDAMQRYSYRNQPAVIWWNLVRFGEALSELIGAGARVDDPDFVTTGDAAAELVERAEHIITTVAADEYQRVFKAEYGRLMLARLGLAAAGPDEAPAGSRDADVDGLVQPWLDILESMEWDFNQSFRTLSHVSLSDVGLAEATTSGEAEVEDEASVNLEATMHSGTNIHSGTNANSGTNTHGGTIINSNGDSSGIGDGGAARRNTAARFFRRDSDPGSQADHVPRVADWLLKWGVRAKQIWGPDDAGRQVAMRSVNPKFTPKSWILDELIQRVEKGGEREILRNVLHMALHPFEESWGWDAAEEARFCGEVPKFRRALQCSCSS